MKEKKGMNPWVFTAVIGVLAILFSVFGMQQQTEALEAREEVKQLKMQLEVANNRAAELERAAMQNRKLAEEQTQRAILQLQECVKAGKRK